MDSFLTISLNALKVRWLAIPKEHPPSIVSQLQLALFTQVPSVHPGTQSKNTKLFFLSLLSPQHSAVRLFECASAICT